MTKLQNPIKDRFEALNRDLRDASKQQKNFGKALDKVRHPSLYILKPHGKF